MTKVRPELILDMLRSPELSAERECIPNLLLTDLIMHDQITRRIPCRQGVYYLYSNFSFVTFPLSTLTLYTFILSSISCQATMV
jgi:hypothetical protein